MMKALLRVMSEASISDNVSDCRTYEHLHPRPGVLTRLQIR
jgi:hypothetical protein